MGGAQWQGRWKQRHVGLDPRTVHQLNLVIKLQQADHLMYGRQRVKRGDGER
jgi:hypothetical protein